MNFRELQVFRTVMGARSMTRAAELLNITQPAVSMHIANFEKALGFKLFERRRGRIQPTPAALRLINQADKTFESMNDLERRADQIARGGGGTLRIASIYSMAFDILPRTIRAFSIDHPDIPVSIVTEESKRIYERISTQHYDFGIAELGEAHPAFEIKPIPQEIMCIIPKSHPIAKLKSIQPSDLEGVPLASLPRWHRLNLELASAFAKVGIRPNFAYEVDLFAVVIALVANGCAIGLADPINLSAFARKDIVVRRFNPPMRFDLGVIYPLDRPRSRLAIDFVSIMFKELKAATDRHVAIAKPPTIDDVGRRPKHRRGGMQRAAHR